MAAKFKLEVVTPDGVAYADDVDMVTIPGSQGEMGVFPNHVPLMTQIVAGELIARKNNHDTLLVVGDGFAGCPGKAPFDRIIVTAAAEDVPEALLDQLADDGIMLLPVGPHNGPQRIIRLTKSITAAGVEVKREELISVRFVPLLPGQAQEL